MVTVTGPREEVAALVEGKWRELWQALRNECRLYDRDWEALVEPLPGVRFAMRDGEVKLEESPYSIFPDYDAEIYAYTMEEGGAWKKPFRRITVHNFIKQGVLFGMFGNVFAPFALCLSDWCWDRFNGWHRWDGIESVRKALEPDEGESLTRADRELRREQEENKKLRTILQRVADALKEGI